MTTNTTPDPNFDGINFNADFFSSSTTYLTQDEASFLYLNKTVPDTATALESFTTGIYATAIQATTASIDIITGDLNASNVNSNAVPRQSKNVRSNSERVLHSTYEASICQIQVPGRLGHIVHRGNVFMPFKSANFVKK